MVTILFTTRDLIGGNGGILLHKDFEVTALASEARGQPNLASWRLATRTTFASNIKPEFAFPWHPGPIFPLVNLGRMYA